MSKNESAVLIAEDNAEIAKLIKLYLEGEGYKTVWAEDGEAGLAAARNEAFSAVLVDIMMPKMDGFEVLAFIKKKKLECQPCGYYDLCGQFSCEYKTGI